MFSVTPLFITNVLGVGQATLGILEGFVEAVSLGTRMLAGVISDFIAKRKAIIAVGYVIALISRPILALAPSVEWVFLGRSLDRIGNGLDASPRDALVGDLSPPEIKGSCYGLRQTLGTTGAIFGSILAMFLLWITTNDYAIVFWVGIIPTALALFVLLAYVKDPVSEKAGTTSKKSEFKLSWSEMQSLPRGYWIVILASFVFMLSNYSAAFVTLLANDLGVAGYMIPLTMVVQNVATSAVAYPIGYLSDRIDRRILLAIGFMVVILSNIALASSSAFGFSATFLTIGAGIWLVFTGIFLWGVQLGFTQSLLSTLVADTCPEKLRGTGFGAFHLLNGCAVLFSNIVVGYLWEHVNPQSSFIFSATAATIALFFLPAIRVQK